MKVSPKLFGYNLECTRRVGYGGLYAEMIQNGKLHAGTEGFYPVEWNGMKGWGQCSERIHLRAGHTYELCVLGGEKTRLRLLTEYGWLLFEAEGPRARFTSPFTIAHARFEAVSNGAIRYLSMQPADSFHGCRRDVLDAIRELRPATIRVPGGCFAERYRWKDGFLPVEERPVITDGGLKLLFSANNGYDGHELNVDDYAAICRCVNAEMEYTVRLNDNEPQDAADLVEYCNGGPQTRYGAMRIARGYAEPYNVKTWYIGNEIAWLQKSDLRNADFACGVNDRFVKAMRSMDPTIRTVASTGNEPDWDVLFVKTAKEVDLCGHHYYLHDTHPDVDLGLAGRAANEITLPRLEKAREILGDRPMRFDEWNLRWGCFGSGGSALYAAGVLCMLIHNAQRLNLDGASYFALVNEGPIRVYPDHVALAPDGEVFKRMATHIGGTLLPGEDACSVTTEHDGYRYTTVYNASTETEKAIHIAGCYEVLTPDGDNIQLRRNDGLLTSLPPATMAFIHTRI